MYTIIIVIVTAIIIVAIITVIVTQVARNGEHSQDAQHLLQEVQEAHAP